MTAPAKSSQPPVSAARQRVSDATDPQAGVAESQDDLSVAAGVDDKTQILDTGNASAPEFKILVLAGPKAGTEFSVEHDEFTVGRAVDNIVSIPDVSVSRKHAQFTRTEGGFTVADLKSGNGTKVNGVLGATKVQHGDEVTLGDTILQFIDLSKPLPDRMKPINTLRSPAGHSAGPAVTTEVEGKLLPISRKTPAVSEATPKQTPPPPVPVPPAAKPEPKYEMPKSAPLPPTVPPKATSARRPAPPDGASRRIRAYAAVGLVMIAVFLGLYALKQRTQEAPADETSAEELPPLIAQAREKVVKTHDWAAAAQIVMPLRDSKDPAVVRWLKAIPVEMGYQGKLAQAKLALDALQFDRARPLLLSIPEEADVYPQAQAELQTFGDRINHAIEQCRQTLASSDRAAAVSCANNVLLADPDNEAARQIKEEASKPVKAAPGGKTAGKPAPAPAPPPPPAPVAPKLPFAGPWLTAYMGNQLKDALRLAGTSSDPEIKDRFAGMLRDFSANYTQGMQAADAKHTLESLRYLNAALRIDQQIMVKRESQLSEDRPGHEVRKQISNIEYLLSLDSRSDDSLGIRAKHLRNALIADSTNELARKGLNECYDKARQVFMQAYVLKGTQPQEAMRLFRIVLSTLPADDEKSQKSKYWIEQLGGGQH